MQHINMNTNGTPVSPIVIKRKVVNEKELESTEASDVNLT